MLRNSDSQPETNLPGRISTGKLQNRPSGRPKAGRRVIFNAFSVRIQPKSGPETRFPARRRYCLAWGVSHTRLAADVSTNIVITLLLHLIVVIIKPRNPIIRALTETPNKRDPNHDRFRQESWFPILISFKIQLNKKLKINSPALRAGRLIFGLFPAGFHS